METTEMLDLFDQIIIRKLNGQFYATLETVKSPNNRHAILASSDNSVSFIHALASLMTKKIIHCPECENRMEWSNLPTRDGITFLPKCPVCKKIGGIELQAEEVAV